MAGRRRSAAAYDFLRWMAGWTIDSEHGDRLVAHRMAAVQGASDGPKVEFVRLAPREWRAFYGGRAAAATTPGSAAEKVGVPQYVRVTRGPRRNPSERLFIGVFPAGISYADRSREKHGDYAKCAFLPYDTLELKIEPDCPRDLLPLIERDAAKIQSRRGQQYQVSSSGQTVLLGGGHARVARSPRGSNFKVIHDPGEAFTYVNRLGFAPSGPIGYRQHDLGVVVDKLLEASGQTTWYHKEFRPFKVRFQNYIAEGTGYRYGQFIVIGPDKQVRVLELYGVKTH